MGAKLCKHKHTIKVKQVQDLSFDLIDDNGDQKISKKESTKIASMIHQQHISQSESALNKLKLQDPNKYLYKIIDKKHGSNLNKSDFKKVACTVPTSVWIQQILPVLRQQEIDRLQNY